MAVRSIQTHDDLGKLHSVDGQPSLYSDRLKMGCWHSHGKDHREDGYSYKEEFRGDEEVISWDLNGRDLHGRLLLW